MNYEDDIQIDETALDVEWLSQPSRMAKYCTLAAEAHRVMDLAKERLDFVEATLSRDIRADPAAYDVVVGSRGITEDAIKTAITVNEQYRAASRAYFNAKYENDVAVGAVRAFDQRRTALESLVRLHGQNYFAGPSVPHDLSDMRVQREALREDRDRAAQRRVRITSPSGSVPERPRLQRRS